MHYAAAIAGMAFGNAFLGITIHLLTKQVVNLDFHTV